MTFEDVVSKVWSKIKQVKLTDALGFYGNFITVLSALAIIFGLGIVLVSALAMIFFSVPWPITLIIFVMISGAYCSKKWGFGKKEKEGFYINGKFYEL